MPSRDRAKQAELTNDIRQAIYQGLNKYEISKHTKIKLSTIEWYINKITLEDSLALAAYGEDILFSEVAKAVGQYDSFIKELNGIMREEESMPKDKIDAIKTKMELINTKIGILSLGIKGNIKQIESDTKKYSGQTPQIPGEPDNSINKHKSNNTNKTKGMVLQQSKSNNKRGDSNLLPKPPGRPRKTSRHYERIGDDAVSDSTTGTGKQEEGD